MTGMVAAPPVSGGGCTMSRSTPGSAGTITPSERSSSSLSGAPVSGAVVGGSSGVVARGVFSCTSGGAGGSGLSACARASVRPDPTEAESRAAASGHRQVQIRTRLTSNVSANGSLRPPRGPLVVGRQSPSPPRTCPG